MAETYKIKDEIIGIQNLLLKNTIAQQTNIELLQSEQAVREVYAEYAKKINSLGDKIFKLKEHMVEYKTVITKSYFDSVFSDVYNDLQTLYIHVKYVDDLLGINLEKNKKFFNTLEKRIMELENKLDIARLNVNSMISFDKVYFEGFSNKSVVNNYTNIDLDKKTGHITLKPIETRYHNSRYNIKSVSATTYPVHNVDGGVIFTTNKLNTFEDSYRRDGTNDMLQNGLWKEEVYCNDIPNLQLRINDDYLSSYLQFDTQGIVSYVDIEFENIIDMNTLEIDLFGEFETTILAVLHKSKEDAPWNPMVKLKKELIGDIENYVDSFQEESAFNIIKYRNLELQDLKFLRIIFNQKHYSIIDSSQSELNKATDKINRDLAERRLEVIKLDGGSDSRPAKPKSYNYDSLHAELTDIVEFSSNVEEMIQNIIKVMEPSLKMIDINFDKYLRYQIGAWSIEPKSIKYVGEGRYRSTNYEFTEKAVVAASLITKQEDIKENSCNWFISNAQNDITIPIIPNDEIVRKEPINIINKYYYREQQGWDTGTLIQLDFPIDADAISAITLYEDGREISIGETVYQMFNSTMIYIESIKDPRKHKYVIKYLPAKFETVNIYTLYRYQDNVVDDPTPFAIAAPRAELLELFLDLTGLKDRYTIRRARAINIEYQKFFPGIDNIVMSQGLFSSFDADTKNKLNAYFSIQLAAKFVDGAYQEYSDGNLDATGQSLLPGILPSIPLANERTLI